MNTKRRIAVGKITLHAGIVIVTEKDIEACWRAQIADEMDALPEVLDAAGPHYPMLLSDEEAQEHTEDYESWQDDIRWMQGGC